MSTPQKQIPLQTPSAPRKPKLAVTLPGGKEGNPPGYYSMNADYTTERNAFNTSPSPSPRVDRKPKTTTPQPEPTTPDRPTDQSIPGAPRKKHPRTEEKNLDVEKLICRLREENAKTMMQNFDELGMLEGSDEDES